MTKESKQVYSWNRNAAHHRIAITRFAAYSLVFSCMIGGLFTIGFSMFSDHSREYVAATAACVLISIIVSFVVMLYTMTAMYVWVNEEGKVVKEPPHPIQKEVEIQAFYQTDTGWQAGKPYKKKVG